jgi:hypothetical protein
MASSADNLPTPLYCILALNDTVLMVEMGRITISGMRLYPIQETAAFLRSDAGLRAYSVNERQLLLEGFSIAEVDGTKVVIANCDKTECTVRCIRERLYI